MVITDLRVAFYNRECRDVWLFLPIKFILSALLDISGLVGKTISIVLEVLCGLECMMV